MLTDQIQKQLIEAMKAKDSFRVSTLRLLNSEIKNAKIDNHGELTDELVLSVIKKEAKKRKDSIEAYEKGGRPELAESEKNELAILQEYLPEELSDSEIEKLVDEAIAETGTSSVSDLGKVMPVAMAKAAGRADGKKISELVRNKLT